MIDKAIILSAGQGTRLLPLTAERPKCLIEVGGKSILDHQLDALAEAGVRRRIVVGGYRIAQVAAHLAARGDGVELLLNPFWAVSSSISSVWAARDRLDGGFVILNGDTVHAAELIRRGIAQVRQGVSIFLEPIDHAEHDDMLARVEDGAVQAVGKMLDPLTAHHRSLGVIAGLDDGGAYRAQLEAVIGRSNGIQAFHHQLVDELARKQPVHPIVLPGGGSIEIDRVEDIARWGR